MKRWQRWLLGALIVWIAIVTWWALTPVTDTVPTGKIGKDQVPTYQTVECDAPLSGNTQPTEPLPELEPPRAYERTPCELPHENDRLMFAIDVAVFLAGIGVVAKTWKSSADEPEAEAAFTT